MPDIAEKPPTLSAPEEGATITALLENFDGPITEGRMVTREGEVHEFVRLPSDVGESYAMIEWKKEWRPLTSARTHHWQSLRGSSLLLFDEGIKTTVSDLTEHQFGNVANALGFHHNTYKETESDTLAEAWVVPSPERANYALQHVFNRRAEDGFPALSTFFREDGSSGLLTPKEFFEEVDAGRLPFSDDKNPKRLRHDIEVHESAYAVLPRELFQFVRGLVRTELTTDHDWDNLPEDGSATTLMKSFDSLTAKIGSFLDVYRAENSQNHQLTTALETFLGKVTNIPAAEQEALAAGFAEQTLAGISEMTEIAEALDLAA